MTYQSLVLETGPVCRLRLNRPPLNVLTIDGLEEFAAACQEAATVSEARVVLLSSAIDGAFSAGVDVADHTPQRISRMLDAVTAAFLALYELEMPVVAAVEGHCLGGGFELVQACDLVLASPGAIFGQPEISLAVFAPIASCVLPRRIGAARAAELCLTGQSIIAAQALEWGLVNRIVPESTLAAESEATAGLFLDLSREGLSTAKRALRIAETATLRKDLEQANQLYLKETANSPDADEGLRAFLEKRKPRWK